MKAYPFQLGFGWKFLIEKCLLGFLTMKNLFGEILYFSLV